MRLDSGPHQTTTQLSDVLDAMRATVGPLDPDDQDLVTTAHKIAENAHAGQMRKSGAPYFAHPVSVAIMVAELGLPAACVAAALCHDVVEDTDVTLEELRDLLGDRVAVLVDGLTKIHTAKTRKATVAANALAKLIVACAGAGGTDVIAIKLCDRLDNIREMPRDDDSGADAAAFAAAFPVEKRQRIARETLEVYAPLAHRLGLGALKWQLEDHAFAQLHPEEHRKIRELVNERAPQRDAYLEAVTSRLQDALSAAGIAATVSGRGKHLWSVFEKMAVRGKTFDEIHDLLGMRIIVEDPASCYAAIGALHAELQPVPGAMKDYIANPRFNLYQSLHLLVVGPRLDLDGQRVGPMRFEVQIRTQEMHQRAEFGVAAHFGYKAALRQAAGSNNAGWVDRALGWKMEAGNPEEFLARLKGELACDEVIALTPRGDIIALPEGACAIDFAYAVHTEVGNRCIGAKVDGQLAPLADPLHSGQVVEIITSNSETAGPRQEWLTLARTPHAQSRIRARLARARRTDDTENGRAALERWLVRRGLPALANLSQDVIARASQEHDRQTANRLYRGIGTGELSAAAVASSIEDCLKRPLGIDGDRLVVEARTAAGRGLSSSVGVHVEGLSGVVVTVASCCNPEPGTAIVGELHGPKVVVHDETCVELADASQGQRRLVGVEWVGIDVGLRATISLDAFDRARLLADVASALSDVGANITEVRTSTGPGGVAHQQFEMLVSDEGHLAQSLDAVRAVRGVLWSKVED